MPKESLAFAIDYPTLADARPTLESLSGLIGYAKIGLELFTREGPDAVKQTRAAGIDVFLDLKLHDIPETVERAVAGAAALDARLLTIHCSGGPGMIERAVKRAQADSSRLTLVGVTVLTSLDAADLEAVGVGASPADQVLRLATMAWKSGLRAFVCSPREVGALRAALGSDAILVTPGIRPAGTATHDQKRAATPRSAIVDGADILVVGRPIRDAASPPQVTRQILAEVDEALALRRAGSP
ncbi:MAG: orotidine-5'-phosphate decarboxylase [Deltaproteobacteria bacterium]|nr:orotidine-5'-phosphate decarboxylase [Deltaproteobacteria bacterium]